LVTRAPEEDRLPAGFPRWHNTDGGEQCPVCENAAWVSIMVDGYEESVACRWCDKGFEYVSDQLLDGHVTVEQMRARLYELKDIIGVQQYQIEVVETRRSTVTA
jgi:hypothetical protein